MQLVISITEYVIRASSFLQDRKTTGWPSENEPTVPWHLFPHSTSPLPLAVISCLCLLWYPFWWGTNNSKGVNLVFFKMLKSQSITTVPGGSCRSGSGLQQNERECTCKFCLVLVWSFCLCSGTKETKSRKGVEEKRFFRENRKEQPVENIGTNCSSLAQLYVPCELLSECFWAPLRLMTCCNSEESGAQTPPPVNEWKMNSTATSLRDLYLMEGVILL